MVLCSLVTLCYFKNSFTYYLHFQTSFPPSLVSPQNMSDVYLLFNDDYYLFLSLSAICANFSPEKMLSFAAIVVSDQSLYSVCKVRKRFMHILVVIAGSCQVQSIRSKKWSSIPCRPTSGFFFALNCVFDYNNRRY